jgi:phenylacetate-CoA ligase
MVKIRGVAVFPSQIDAVLSGIDDVGSEYQLLVDRDAGGHDEALVRVEADERSGLAERVEHELRGGLGLRFAIEIVAPGTLPRSERKTQRVFDAREGG